VPVSDDTRVETDTAGPAPTGSTPTSPATGPAPTGLAPTAPGPTGPAPTDPAATRPVPTGPATTAPATTGPAATDGMSAVGTEPAAVGTEPAAAGRRGRFGGSRWAGPVALGIVVAALAAFAVHLALAYTDARSRSAAEREVLVPAKSAAARILSYDYRHIQQDATQGAAVLTGDFRIQYETVMRQQIVPQAPKQRAVVQAEVLSAGVSGMNADGTQAVVLVFANQTVSNTATNQPRVDQVRVRLTLDRVSGRWLVSKVDAL